MSCGNGCGGCGACSTPKIDPALLPPNTVHIGAGDPAPEDITIGGTTILAGDPLPPGFSYHYEANPDGSPVPGAGSGSCCVPDDDFHVTFVDGAWVNSDGDTEEAPETDNDGNPIDPAANYNIFDGVWVPAPAAGCPCPVFENEDGTFSDFPTTEDGNPIIPNASPGCDEDPFVSCEAVDGGVEITRCDGSGFCIVPTINTVAASNTGTVFVDSTSAVGDVIAGSEFCYTVEVPKCGPHRVQVIASNGYQFRGNFQSTSNFGFIPQYSNDGGATYFGYNSGGFDAPATNVPTGYPPTGTGPEHDFTDYSATFPMPSGTQTICHRTLHGAGSIITGQVQFNASSIRAFWHTLKKCVI